MPKEIGDARARKHEHDDAAYRLKTYGPPVSSPIVEPKAQIFNPMGIGLIDGPAHPTLAEAYGPVANSSFAESKAPAHPTLAGNPVPASFTFPVTDSAVRVITRDGEPWFVAKDVCDVLGLGNPRSSLALLDEDEKDTVHTVDAIGRGKEMTVISESGLYSLILKSRKPEAKAFKRWVTHDVLPAIRKDGAYIKGEEKVVAGELEEAEFVLRAMTILQGKVTRLAEEKAQLAAKLDRLEDENIELSQENVELSDENTELYEENIGMRPMANKYRQYMNSDGLINITQAAKVLGMTGVALGRILRERNWLFKDTTKATPMQPILDRGFMKVITGSTGNGYLYAQAFITAAGMDALFKMLMPEVKAA